MPPKNIKCSFKMLLKRKFGTKNIKLDIYQLTNSDTGYFLIFMDSSFIYKVSIISTLIIILLITLYVPGAILGMYIDHPI